MRAAVTTPPAASWRPHATLSTLRLRAAVLADIRQFFAERDVLEVDTPLLSRAGSTDPAIASLRTRCQLPGSGEQDYWLHTSPEFAMKRLVAAGSGPIYQLCKVCRDGERGARHHPEFTLLEWYRPQWNMKQLIAEITALLRRVLHRPKLMSEIISYRSLFQRCLGIDPWHTNEVQLRAAARQYGVAGATTLELTVDGWLDLLLTHCIEQQLGRAGLTFVHAYPPSQAALAQLQHGDIVTAQRFELYFHGMELANGFQELTDAAEQQRRFAIDLQQREQGAQPAVPMDTALLDALTAGLPPTAGVALGIDRLLMLMINAQHIDNVLAFPIERA